MADLIFWRPPYAGGPVHLVFGGTPTPADPPVTVSVYALLQADVSASASVSVPPLEPVEVSAAALLSVNVSVSASVGYDVRVRPMLDGRAAAPHQTGTAARIGATARWQPATPDAAARRHPWQQARRTAHQAAILSDAALPQRQQAAARWRLGTQAGAQSAAAHQRAVHVHTARADGLQHSLQRHTQAAAPLQAGVFIVLHHAGRWQTARAQERAHTGRSGASLRLRGLPHVRMPWQTGTYPRNGRSVLPLPPVRPPRVPSTHLVFACPPWAGGAVHLVFGHSCINPGPLADLYILPARYYMAVHQLEAHRLPDMQPVPIFGVSLSADAGSFAWTFSASAPASVFEQLAPASGLPARLRITLDGIVFDFVVDSLQREESFGKRGVRIAGRSATALLARPYARETARLSAAPATAQQLAEAALEFSGASLDWSLTDWLVPAGAWSHTGTPLSAVQTIVEAAGGYLQSHRTGATLLARHPYPELPGGIPGGPWNWYASGVTPDVELAPDAIITSGIERRDGPDINSVYVSGTTQGVLALVKRTSSAADKLASLITDPLITAGEAALQRGLSVLGAAGPKHIVSISLPVLTGPAQPGVLDVGQLVQINTATPWRGRVRSVSVGADFGREVRQTVQIERHLEAA